MKKTLIFTLLALSLSEVKAEIVIQGTRVIYPSDAREVTIQLNNNGEQPALMQAWLDTGDANSTPDQSSVPFIISPPISRIEANKGQALRVTALPTAARLNQNQESIFWLNVIDIPPKPEGQANVPENYMQLAIRSRLKFFYRPSSIKQNPMEAYKQLAWQLKGDQLNVNNPTPFYITISSIEQNVAGKPVDIIEQGLMLEPFSKQNVQLKSTQTSNMKYSTINDYGTLVESELKF